MAVVATRMVDTIGQNVSRLAQYPYWQDRPVASYTTRRYAASAGQFGQFKHPVRIDQAPTNALYGHATVKDGEPGAALNSNIAALAAAGARFVAYTFEANLGALRQAVNRTGKGANVRYWVAWWDLNEAQALNYLAQHPDVVAIQWNSPSTRPNLIVPGTGLTARQLNVDLSVGRADFWLPQAKPQPKPAAEHGAKGQWKGQYALTPENGKWATVGVPGKDVVKSTLPLTDYAVVGVDLHNGQHKIKGIDRKTGATLFRG